MSKRTIGKTNAHKLAKALGTDVLRYQSKVTGVVAEPKAKYSVKAKKRN